mgnify:CR=1 FL=1
MKSRISNIQLTREELNSIEDRFDELLLGVWEKKRDQYGGHDPISNAWDGKYVFSFETQHEHIRVDFSRVGRTDYQGTIDLQLDASQQMPLLDVLTSVPKLAKILPADYRTN